MNRPSRPSLFLSIVVALVVSGTSSAQAAKYTIKQIGPIPGHNGSTASAINNAGQIAGSSDTITAYRWSQGTLDALPALPGGTITRAEGIADNGSVVGSSYTTANGVDHATVWVPSGPGYAVTDLGVGPGDIFSLAMALNAGRIVGLSDNGIAWKPAAWLPPSPGPGPYTLHMLPLLAGDFGGTAEDVNASGIVVGDSSNGGNSHPVRWTYAGGTWTVTNLGGLAANFPSEAYAINASGVVAGYATSPVSFVEHAVRWDTGGLVDLGVLNAGWRTLANGINDAGDIVGTSGPFSYTTAWVRPVSQGTLIDLNACLPPATPWTLVRAEDINNQGQITGYGIVGNFDQSFLLTPISTFLTGPTAGSAGQTNTLQVTGATPGGLVRFVFASSGGETQIPACPGANFDMAQAVTLGRATADASGTAVFAFVARPTWAGLTFLFQALDTPSCRVTNVNQVTF